jgi:hypothetical protein
MQAVAALYERRGKTAVIDRRYNSLPRRDPFQLLIGLIISPLVRLAQPLNPRKPIRLP